MQMFEKYVKKLGLKEWLLLANDDYSTLSAVCIHDTLSHSCLELHTRIKSVALLVSYTKKRPSSPVTLRSH